MIIPLIGLLASVTFLLFFGSRVENIFGAFIIFILSVIIIQIFFYLDSHFIEQRRNSEDKRK